MSSRFCRFVFALLLFGCLTPVVVAQEASPVASPEANGRFDLAAMVLDSTSMPEGFALVSEHYIPASQMQISYTGDLISQAEIDATGLQWFYESSYANTDGTIRIRSYVEQYPSVEDATAGFELLEDESRIVSLGAKNTDKTDAGIGDQPSEISLTTIPQSDSDVEAKSLDTTFRIGDLVAGIAIETNDGTNPDATQAQALAKSLFDRVTQVQRGQEPADVDLSLPGRILPLDSVADWTPGQGGYISALEAFGESGSQVAADFLSGYLTSTATYTGRVNPFPVISVHVETFTSEDAPLSILSDPTPYQPAFVAIEEMPIDRIEGASAAIGFRYANPLTDSSVVDSFRIVLVVENQLVSVDVQGSLDVQTARSLATLIAQTQAACLVSDQPCQMPEIPGELLTPTGGGTPTAA